MKTVMPNKNETVTKPLTVAEFKEAFGRFVDSIIDNAVALGGMLVALVDRDPTAIDTLQRDGFSRATLMKLYDIGTGKLDPRLLIDDSPAAKMIQALPLVQQKHLLDEGVAVVTIDDGKAVQRVKPIALITRTEIPKVFRSDGGVRTVEEQKEIAQREGRGSRREPAQRYKVENGELIIMPSAVDTVFSLAQLTAIVEQMKQQSLSTLSGAVKHNQIPR